MVVKPNKDEIVLRTVAVVHGTGKESVVSLEWPDQHGTNVALLPNRTVIALAGHDRKHGTSDDLIMVDDRVWVLREPSISERVVEKVAEFPELYLLAVLLVFSGIVIFRRK